jgi:glycosyltransferase involved in cell wall biosynthesis
LILRPILSVLIPTRNRPAQVEKLLSIISQCESNEVEFLISDNSDEPYKFDSVPKNLRVFRPDQVLNMTANWNFISSKANGVYATFIGDDDAFIPSKLVKLLELLRFCTADLVWTPTSGYIWPSGEGVGNFFQEKRKLGREQSLDEAQQLVSQMNLSAKIPIPYNGNLFRSSLISEFEKAYPGERFFSSRIPDVNAGVKLLFLCKTQISFRSTVFISGTSPLSNGHLTRNDPLHPRALEFNDPSFNPPPYRGGWPKGNVPPFGFITFFEGIQESLLQLNVSFAFSNWSVALKSVMLSSSPDAQKEINEKMWPNHRVATELGYMLSRVLKNPIFTRFSDLVRISLIMIRVLLRQSTVVSLRGKALGSSLELVEFLESNDVLDRNVGVIRRLAEDKPRNIEI